MNKRRKLIVALGAGKLAIQEVDEVALVADLGEPVGDGEIINLVIVQPLDVAA